MNNPPLEADVDRIVAVFRDAKPRADVRDVLEISSQTYSLLRAGNPVEELEDLVRAFVAADGNPSEFARWAQRRKKVRAWWTD